MRSGSRRSVGAFECIGFNAKSFKRPPANFNEAPEWTAASRPEAEAFSDVFPAHFESWEKQRGRPPVEAPKVHIGFRLAADVVEGVRATGKVYNARVDKVLREAIAKGLL